MILFENLRDISDIKITQQDTLEAVEKSVEIYKKRLTTEKDGVQVKREKINDSIKDAETFIQIKASDLLK